MKTRLSLAAGALVLGALFASACGGDGAGDTADEQPEPTSQASSPATENGGEPIDEEGDSTFQVSSPAIENGGEIPVRFTCVGDDVSPPLEWSDAGADSYVVILIDPDAGDFVHWILYDIPGSVTSLEEGVVVQGATEGPNSFGSTGYRGPCPPGGQEHRYTFIVYALEGAVDLGDLDPPSAANIDDAVVCCLQARGQLQATYGGTD